MQKKLYLFLSFISIFFPFLFNEADFKGLIYLNYCIQIIILFALVLKSRNQYQTLLMPSYMSALYLILSFILGDLLLRNGMYMDPSHFGYYQTWANSRISCSFFNACFFVAYLAKENAKPMRRSLSMPEIPIRPSISLIIACLAFILLALQWGKYYDESGPTINFPIIFASLSAFFIFYFVKDRPLYQRVLVYILVILVFCLFRFSNKREAIFLMVPVMLLEARYIREKNIVTIKNAFIGLLGITTLTLLIVIMSIQRVDHHHDATAVIDLSDLPALGDAVVTYLSSDHTLPLLANNFEVDYVFVNSHQAVEFIEKEPELMTWGSTYLKPLLAPIPRFIMPDKPEAAITLYSYRYDRAAAEAGLCLPLSLQVEGYWNFGYLGGLICVYIIFLLFNNAYLKFYDSIIEDKGIKTVVNMYIYYMFFTLYRDCGFTKLLTAIVAAYIYSYIIRFIVLKNKREV